MRLFLLVIIAPIAYTLIPLAIDHRIEQYVRSYEGHSLLERVYLAVLRPLARTLDATSFVLARCHLYAAAQRTEEFLLGYHFLAKSIGTIDYRCGELAPGFWDWDVDCAMHNCGSCMECLDQHPTVLDMNPTRRSA